MTVAIIAKLTAYGKVVSMRMGLAVVVLVSLWVGWASGVVLPSEPDHVISLNGTWRFRLEDAAGQTFYYAPDYHEDVAWKDLVVPGNWEMAGFSPATYAKLGDDVGLYRVWFEVPAAWRGRRVRVNFDAVQNGAELWCNGQPVAVDGPSWGRSNYHESGWTAFQADLTPVVKFGAKNLLALRVSKNTRSAAMDCGDYFYLGGIHRRVDLFSVPDTHVSDLTVRTTLLPAGKAEVKVVANVAGKGAHVVARLDGKPFVVDGQAGGDGTAKLSAVMDQPRLWSAERPELYRLGIELKDEAGNVIEKVDRRVGIREVTTAGGVLRINGVPVKLAGICRHDIYPSMGSAVNEEVWRKDLSLMKAANINAVRTSHYPYGEGFYDLCDEMGMYVIDEMPDFQRPSDDPDMTPAFVQRTREMVARDKNHPCVIAWTVANEVHKGPNLQAAVDQIKSMDLTRPTIVSQMPAELYGTEMDDLHYPDLARMDKDGNDAKRRAKWPVVYLEHPNNWDVRLGADPGCWDGWTIGLQRVWDRVMKYDGMCGTFLWEWQDRAIADQCATKPYAYDPATGLQYVKIKGIVDGWRHPRAWYYDLKMVYSPIQVGREIDRSGWPGKVGIEVRNDYSFTDLAELDAKWSLVRDGKLMGSGTGHLKLAPRSRGKVELELPEEKADTLRVDFHDPRGWNVTSCAFALSLPKPAPAVARVVGLKFPRFNLVRCTLKNDPAHWKQVTRDRGELVNVTVEPAADGRRLYDCELSDVKSVEADVVLGGATVGHLDVTNEGGMFRYRLEWTGKKVDVQEFGWVFELPLGCDQFSWRREGAWSVYPEKHIGRLHGTARPDSADVSLTNMTREDAFDFNSTKYDCDWASLTDGAGRGVLVEFSAAERHHVKGGFGEGGKYQLVVNRQCSPPRDYGSPIVKDLYLELTPGKVVQGSFTVK